MLASWWGEAVPDELAWRAPPGPPVACRTRRVTAPARLGGGDGQGRRADELTPGKARRPHSTNLASHGFPLCFTFCAPRRCCDPIARGFGQRGGWAWKRANDRDLEERIRAGPSDAWRRVDQAAAAPRGFVRRSARSRGIAGGNRSRRRARRTSRRRPYTTDDRCTLGPARQNPRFPPFQARRLPSAPATSSSASSRRSSRSPRDCRVAENGRRRRAAA